MTRDAADYRADSSSSYSTRDLPRARAVVTAAGLADAKTGAGANQRACGGAVNRAPSQLALLRASAQKQRDGGNRRQQQ